MSLGFDFYGLIHIIFRMQDQIQLLQFLICSEFKQEKQDGYTAEMIHSNIYTNRFPYHFPKTFVVTCWRKDKRFHKEVIEYSADYGETMKSPPMDIEPVTSSVLFRWHKHQFPTELSISKPTILTVRVILDWKTVFESYLMIEEAP